MPTKPEIIAELNRLQRAQSLRRMDKGLPILEHTVRHSQEDGDPRQLTEAAIAKAIYDGDYDSLGSPKVRTAMSRLRQALTNYYNGEGKENPLRISYPHEGYRAEFTPTNPQAVPHAKPGSAPPAAPPVVVNLTNHVQAAPPPNVTVEQVNHHEGPRITLNVVVHPPVPPTVNLNNTVLNQILNNGHPQKVEPPRAVPPSTQRVEPPREAASSFKGELYSYTGLSFPVRHELVPLDWKEGKTTRREYTDYWVLHPEELKSVSPGHAFTVEQRALLQKASNEKRYLTYEEVCFYRRMEEARRAKLSFWQRLWH